MVLKQNVFSKLIRFQMVGDWEDYPHLLKILKDLERLQIYGEIQISGSKC